MKFSLTCPDRVNHSLLLECVFVLYLSHCFEIHLLTHLVSIPGLWVPWGWRLDLAHLQISNTRHGTWLGLVEWLKISQLISREQGQSSCFLATSLELGPTHVGLGSPRAVRLSLLFPLWHTQTHTLLYFFFLLTHLPFPPLITFFHFVPFTTTFFCPLLFSFPHLRP